MTRRADIRALWTAVAIGLVCALALAGIANARMSSTKLGPTLCETTGGGKFVAIPGFRGEMIDRRLLRDVRWLSKRYSIFVTDGYSMSGVHSINGEHPLGLALDIVPNTARGGTWSDIDRLARWAEPRQNQPRAPFRWVGYDGDAGHGRGHHLHLSFNHSTTRPGRPAKTVQSIRCPRAGGPAPTPPPAPPAPPPEPPAPPPTGGEPVGEPDTGVRNGGRGGGRDGRRGEGRDGRREGRDRDGRRGGRNDARNQGTGRNTGGTGGHGAAGSNSGGIGGKLLAVPPVIETDGADYDER